MVIQPFQLWPTLKYVTVPGTIIAVRVCGTNKDAPLLIHPHKSFVFFGFLVAGEEIESE